MPHELADRVGSVTQTDIDALWLACRVVIRIGDVPNDLRCQAQLRLQRLVSAGVVDHRVGEYPALRAGGDHG